MSKFENQVAKAYAADGWEVLRSGWPDLLLVKKRPDGTLELKAVEVKADGDDLRPNQKRMCAALSTVFPVRDVHQGPGYGNTFRVCSDELIVTPYRANPIEEERIAKLVRLRETSAHELIYDLERYKTVDKGEF